MSSQFKTNKDDRPPQEILEDIHADARMPTLQWLLAEKIYMSMARKGLIVYKIRRFPAFALLEPIYRDKYLEVAKEILEGNII